MTNEPHAIIHTYWEMYMEFPTENTISHLSADFVSSNENTVTIINRDVPTIDGGEMDLQETYFKTKNDCIDNKISYSLSCVNRIQESIIRLREKRDQ